MQQARILIADDDAVTRLDLKATLESLGHKVVGEADNGETAIQLARTLRPDVILLDIMMPRKSGLEVAEALGKERVGALIMLTAYSDVPMIEQATRAGVLSYLVKPFRQQELQPTIEIAMTRYRELVALEGALDSVQERLETNRLVDRAKKILMERSEIEEKEAWRRLQAQALTTNRAVKEVAEAIILTAELNLPPKPRKKT